MHRAGKPANNRKGGGPALSLLLYPRARILAYFFAMSRVLGHGYLL